MANFCLPDRALLRLEGPDAKTLLQGLITSSVDNIAEKSWLYAGLLTPQGKYLHDFFMTEEPGGALILDCPKSQITALQRKLMMYRLRSKVEIALDDRVIVCATNGDMTTGFMDPRHTEIGQRCIAPVMAGDDLEAYDAHRLRLGIPDGPQDFRQDKTLWLETNADLLAGVDFEKGCYVGQELTARMRYRGKVRRRLIPITLDAPVENGTAIMLGEREIGDVRSNNGAYGIANLKVEDIEKGPLMAGPTEIKAWVPDWLAPAINAAKENA